MDMRDRILETAFKLFLEKGFDNVSTTEIKKESNAATGSFYHHFGSREGLLVEVIDKYIFSYFNRTLDKIKNCKGTPKERLKAVILQIIGYDSSTNKVTKLYENSESFIIDYRNLHLLYLGSLQTHEIISKRYRDFQLRLIEFIMELIDEGKAQGELKKDIDTYKNAILMQSVIDGTFLLWLSVPEIPIRETMQSNIDQLWEYMKC